MPVRAFVEILPGKEGLVHIPELADYRVPTVEDGVNIRGGIQVLVTEIDRQGRVNLSRRALLEPAENGQDGEEGGERNGDSGGDRRPRPFNERRGRDDRGGRGGGGGGGYGNRDRDRGPRRDRDMGGSGTNGGPSPSPSPQSAGSSRPHRERSGDRPRGSATGRRATMHTTPDGDHDATE